MTAPAEDLSCLLLIQKYGVGDLLSYVVLRSINLGSTLRFVFVSDRYPSTLLLLLGDWVNNFIYDTNFCGWPVHLAGDDKNTATERSRCSRGLVW